MKIKLTLIFFALFFSTLKIFAQISSQQVVSKIEKVTVFTSGAEVLRKAKITVPAGKTEFVFSGIARNIDKQSIQVKGEGNFTILSVIHQINYLKEQDRQKEISSLLAKSQILKRNLAVETSTLAVYKNEEQMLIKNQSIGGSNNGVKTSELKEAIDYQRGRLTEALNKQLEITNEIQKIDSSLIKLDSQLKTLNQSNLYSTSEIVVTVSSKTQTEGSFELDYYVKDATWFATYDLRVKDITSPIDLSLKANVTQHTGENWNDIKLTLSNGNPMENGVTPQLQPWLLRFGYPNLTDVETLLQGRVAGITTTPGGGFSEVSGKVLSKSGEALVGANVMAKGASVGTVTDVDGNFSINIPSNIKTLVVSYSGFSSQEQPITSNSLRILLEENQSLQEVVVSGYGVRRKINNKPKVASSIPLETEEQQKIKTLNFTIEAPYTILSDGKVASVDIKNIAIPAIYEYVTVPKLQSEAFLIAKITGWQDLNLLDGTVNLYFEGAFLGKSLMDLSHAGDTLDISLGQDKGITVERKKLKEYSSKQFLSNYKTESRAYEILIRNNKQLPIKITVLDQFPVSTTKEITVDDQEYKDAKLNKESKILTWEDQIPAKQEKKHVLRYSVKYPKDQVVVID
jgi:hypothetical protein